LILQATEWQRIGNQIDAAQWGGVSLAITSGTRGRATTSF
jgi:hypothetical protein